MSTAERTYSFRAPAELAERLAAALDRFAALSREGPEIQEWLSRELRMELARRLRRAPEIARDRSAFMRSAVEMLVGVTEKVSLGLELGPEYAAAREEDQEADAFHRAALKASLPVWRDE